MLHGIVLKGLMMEHTSATAAGMCLRSIQSSASVDLKTGRLGSTPMPIASSTMVRARVSKLCVAPWTLTSSGHPPVSWFNDPTPT